MSLPADSTIEDVKVRIRQSVRNRNIGRVEQVVLREGPRAFRLATLFEIVCPEAGDVYHYSLRKITLGSCFSKRIVTLIENFLILVTKGPDDSNIYEANLII